MEILHLTKTRIVFSAHKLSRELNKLLHWETYNPLQNWKNGLTIIKIAFYALWKRFGWKTRSRKHLKIPVLNRQRRRFRAENNVLRGEVIELSEMIYCNDGPERDLVNGNLTSYKDGDHVFGAQTIEMSEISCCNEKPITLFQNWIKIVLQSSKLRFTRCGSDFVEKPFQANN